MGGGCVLFGGGGEGGAVFLCVFVSVHVWLVGRGGEVGPVFVWACACGGGGVREEILRWNATSRCVCVCGDKLVLY